jgi:phospholipase/carboxylesterase
MRLTRRQLLKLGAGIITASVSATCNTERSKGEILLQTDNQQGDDGRRNREGILLARPGRVNGESPTGEQRLKLDDRRDGLLYVPPGYRRDRPAPLALMLHGAGGNAQHSLSLLRSFADSSGILLLAPESRRETWDVIGGGYGPDVAFIDRALEQTFNRYAVDVRRIAFGGFSDGASYALSLGIINGDLSTHVIAFSPGFMSPTRQKGSPRLFISHGTRDQVLPIDRCSRRIVPQVKHAGYDVRYREFDGPHTVPPMIAREAVDWFIG